MTGKRATFGAHASRNIKRAMSREVKTSVLSNVLVLAVVAVLAPAANGNQGLEELAELNLGVKAEPRQDTVYLEVNGAAEVGGSGAQWVRQMQAITTSSPAPHVWASRVDDLPHPRRKVFGPKPRQTGRRFLQRGKTLDQPLQSVGKLRAKLGGLHGEDRLQSDFPGHEGEEDYGNLNDPSSYITQQWLQMRPLVQCSGGAMTLTAQGRGYSHLFVERADAAPVHVLQLLPDCGYFVRATWRDLLLTASFDACYILRENGSYVLPLLWWGRRVKISCPMIPASAPDTPSGFCSDFGMAIMMQGDQVAVEKYKVKVNGEWVPFVSDTCACRVDSPPEYVVFYIPFTAPCTKDAGGTLYVLLNLKEYTLYCRHLPSSTQQPLHPGQTQAQSAPEKDAQYMAPYQPHQKPYIPHLPPGLYPFNYPNPYLMGPNLAGEMHNLQHSYSDPMSRSELAPLVGPPGTPIQQHKYSSASYIPQLPAVPGTAAMPKRSQKVPPVLPPVGHYHPGLTPVMDHQYPHIPAPKQHHSKPTYKPSVHEVQRPQLPAPTTKMTVASTSGHKKPPKPPLTQVPHKAPVVQLPPRHPVLPTAPSKMSSSLSCKGDHLVADLPTAKMDSVKVKDVKKKNTWVPVSSAPAHCGYSLQRKEQGVVFSSPLPTCHSRTLSSSFLALSLKFWDVVQLRHRVLQLRCPATEPQAPAPTTAEAFAPWTWVTASLVPKPEPSPSQPAKQLASPSQFQKPVDMSLYPPKPNASSPQSKLTVAPSRWPKTTPLPSKPLVPHIQCYSQYMSVTLPYRSVTGLAVQIPSRGHEENINAVLLNEAPSHCGYLVKEDHNGFIHVVLPYTSCHMAYQEGQYKITLKYRLEDGHGVEALLSCQVPKGLECNLPVELQLDCGPSSVSAPDCHALGCCYSSDNDVCYYPMDECTADRHFVFSIPASLTDPPLSPALLIAAGNSSCIPQKVVGDYALFKIPLDGCGAHKYEVGKTVIYMLEILNTLQSLSLNYGTITRDSPIRLLVECRYLPGTLASVSYLVKSPSLGPSVQAQGVFGVQLRIAKDQHYSSYYPQYHRPLTKLLGKPLYLEVRLLNAPDPSVVLLVHYCVAYPRSAQSAWVLIYDGCPNPLDVTPTNNPPPPPPEAVANHARRFTISTFQFLEPNKDQSKLFEEVKDKEEEEIYFMCATEVCLPSEGPCVEGCFENALTTKS